jgi:hypothetical protein
MKHFTLSRRQFFKASAFGAGALALPGNSLASAAAAAPHAAQAAADQPQGPAIAQPTFNPIATNTTFGPLTDISMGWDGTLWGIDAQGAPHVYDAVNDAWAQHGDGIDAAGHLSSGDIIVFRGSEVVTIGANTVQASPPKPIAAQWPNLPDSFKLGVVGAALDPISRDTVLFNGGRYVFANGTLPPGKLTDLQNWPQTARWKDGLIDGIYERIEPTDVKIYALNSGEAVLISPRLKTASAPVPLTDILDPAALPPGESTGVDAITTFSSDETWFFKDAAVYFFDPFKQSGQSVSAIPPRYLGDLFTNWPATWHPTLRHAPNGRDGNLWSVLPTARGSAIVQHNGDGWSVRAEQADHVGVGQDDTVMLASAQKLWRFNGTGFDAVSQASNLVQVSLGNANAVHARDSNGTIYNFDPTTGALTQNTTAGTATHIATTNDGTLWHAKPNDSNIHRYLTTPNVLQAGIPVKSGLVSTVQKVAATGFGSAHCLTQDLPGKPQAYRYDSPYVFQTEKSYGRGVLGEFIEQGNGLLYVNTRMPGSSPTQPNRNQIAALDAHTGVEVARTPALPSPMQYGQPVFDPANNLVYVCTAPTSDLDNTTPGQVLALDGRTLTVKWAFTTASGIDAAPTLFGTRLCLGDRGGKLYMFDTAAALANAANPAPAWTWQIPVGAAQTHRISTPTFVPDPTGGPDDLIYMSAWSWSDLGTPQANAQIAWAQIAFSGNSLGSYVPLHTFTWNAGPLLQRFLGGPVRGPVNIGGSAAQKLSQALIYNCGDAVIGVGAGPTNVALTLPAGEQVYTGFAYDLDANVVWFGTNAGRLFALNTDMHPVNHTPFSDGSGFRIIETTPVIYKDSRGTTTVLFNVNDTNAGSANLMGFDPATGNVASVPTANTIVTTLSSRVTNGVIYALGVQPAGAIVYPDPQAFGIRVDALPQAERDFIIESQLMQDPDETTTGGSTNPNNPIPPSKARYQTHLTVVDDQKNPQPNEPIKIWADVPNTAITVDGKQFTIGPNDAAYATTQTGIDGSVVIISDAKDMNASALRVWAGFMNPYERIVVYPDHEWHGRASQSNADAGADPNKPDPSKPNLTVTHNYKGTQLFTQDEKSQGTPTNVANAIGQMNKGLALGGSSPASVAGGLKTVHGSNPAAPYVAYTTLGGMHYGANNARAKRTATIATPIGFRLSKPQGGAHTFTPLSHSDARNAIDALQGKPWDPNNPNGTASASTEPATFVIQRGTNIFTDFWNWLKGVVSAIEDVIVSVADDIMVGISFIVNGIKQVFKAIIKVVEDVVNAIGSFFLQLLKLIEDVIEALSVLFHFGEIIWFHNWLKALIKHEINGLKDVLVNNVKGSFDTFIKSGEDAIKAQFDQWRAQITGQSINDLQGGKSSVHSAFNIKDANGNPSSQSVMAGANAQKLKGNLGAGKESSAASSASRATSGAPKSAQDAISDFITAFTNRITGDGDLSAAFAQLKSDFSNLFNSSSGSQFISSALTTLLDLLETVLIALLSVAGAFFDGLFAVIEDLITSALGFMETPLDIPFFSWLYKLLFGSDMTILDLLALVGAIPGTMIFRVATGVYPSQAGLPNPNSLPNGSSTGSSTATTLQRAGAVAPQAAQTDYLKLIRAATGIFNGICIFALGLVSTFSDTFDDAGALPGWIGKAGFVLGLIVAGLSVPAIYTDPSNISKFDWASFGVSAFIALAGGVGLFIENAATARILSVVLAFDNACCLAFIIYAYIDDGDRDSAAIAGFIGNIFSVIPGLVNPAKYLGVAGKALAIFADVVGNLAWMGTTIAAAFSYLGSSPRPLRRLFFPFVPHAPRPVQAHPLAMNSAAP